MPISYATERNASLASMLLNSSPAPSRGAGSVAGSAAGTVVGSARFARSSAPTEADEDELAETQTDTTDGVDSKKKSKKPMKTPAEKSILEADAQKALTQEKQFSKSVCGWTQQAAGGMYT